MNSIQSWKDSMKLLQLQNLKPFLMVTGKAVFDVYHRMNHPLSTRGNWFLGIALVVLIVLTNVINFFQFIWLEVLLLNTTLHTIYFICCLSLRPSVAIKDKAYFIEYLTRYWYLLVLGIVLGNTYVFFIPLMFIFYMFFLLFAFDSGGTVKGLVRALRNAVAMLYYNAPLSIVLYAAVSLLTLALHSLVFFAWSLWGGLTITIILYLIFVPIEVALITNVYIKRLHDQPQFYFDQH